MKVYRLIHKDYDGEVALGLPAPHNETDGEKLINEYFGKMRPYKHCIPYYKNARFAFVSFNALCTFLLASSIKKMTDQEYADINEKFVIQTYDIDTWSAGLSKFMCTYFDDEVVEGPIEELKLEDLSGATFKFIEQPPVPSADIAMIKETYYSKVKFNYN